MPKELLNPTTLYIIGIATVTILLVIFALSIYYYIKAKDIAPFLAKFEAVRRAIADGQKHLEELHAEMKIKQDELAAAKRVIADSNDARKWLRENEPKITALKIEVETLQTKLREANDAFAKRQEELSQLIQTIANKEIEKRDMERRKEDLDHYFSQVESKRTELENKIRELLKAEAEYSKGVQELKNAFATLSQQIEKLERDIGERQEKLKNLDSEIAKRQSEAKQENERLKIEKDTLAQQVAKLQGEANAAHSILAEMDKRRETNDDRWQDLDREFIENARAPRSVKFAESDWLKWFDSILKRNGIVFNERTIKAFHTGLKCGDISPLVVLAGISGTGKSLLPNLYANALGMNFLAVAVQPRWDSPQDMFGFYNYMEGRYKATELSRLLWQFDEWNNPKATKEFSQQLPMNLVLLDEMNLARVEYYFSDLLSRLEIRRGLNLDDEKSRRKAEIEIECNASSANKQTRRLLVSPNTLFVGTMNEDESTQTLSDKVLDRANVLRFGRPQELGAKPNIGGFNTECSKAHPVTFETWKSWQENNPDRIARMKEIFKDINPILETVGRPFAHRVWQAMEHYVSFYPGNRTEDFNNALADQIEMKILPKLNGLELDAHGFDEVKKKLESIIEKIGDDGLKTAFGISCDSNQNSFFKWRGVMR
jgi:predicted  nucleic acid-binding Zn-ribbon protein